MARKKANGLTDVELEVMQILWEKPNCSSDEIRLSMPGEDKRKDSTMRTILGIMEKKGYVTHSVEGRTYHYRPLIRRETAQRSATMRLVDKVFDGSPKLMLQCLLDSGELDEKTLDEVQGLLRKKD